MRIAVVHSFYSSRQPSGENAVVDQQVAALREAGHDVLLVARRTDDVESRPLHAPRSAVAVASGRGASPSRELASFAPDVVHLHNTFPNLGTAWLKQWGPRTVVTLHNYRSVCAAGTLFRDGAPCRDCLARPVAPAVRHACYRDSRVATLPVAVAAAPGGALRRVPSMAARVVVLNEDARTTFGDVLGRPVQVVPNFTSSAPVSDGPRRGWAFVGRFSSEKGSLELMHAWPQGESLDLYGDGPLQQEMRQVVSERGLDVRFHGLTPHADLLASLPDHEGLVVPSMCAEGLPTAVIEGLAHGLPAVISDLVSLAPTLESAGAGVAVSMPASSDEMRRGLERLRAMPRATEAARDLHRHHFSRTAWLERMLPIYREVADAAGA